MKLIGNWNYPTSVRFGAGRIAELGAAVAAAGMSRPLLVTDPRLAELPPVKRALEVLSGDGIAAAVFCDVKPNPSGVECRSRARGSEGRPPRRRDRAWRRLGARCRQGHRLHGRSDAPLVGLRGHRRLVDPRRRQRHPPCRRRADHGGHRLRGGPRRCHHRRGDAHQEGDLPPQDDAGDHHLRSGADRRHAARDHGRHGHGRAGALPGGLLRALLSSARRRHRRRGHAARQGEPRARLRRAAIWRRART